MPRGRQRSRRTKKAATASGVDRIDALPDDVLQLALSVLPSDEAVQTCVLSRRWHHLWKSSARYASLATEREWRARKLNNFMSYLLLLCDQPPVDECEIRHWREFFDEDRGEVFRFAELWIRHAVSLCQARGAQGLHPHREMAPASCQRAFHLAAPDEGGAHSCGCRGPLSGFFRLLGF